MRIVCTGDSARMNFVNFFYFFILFYFSVTQKHVGHEFPKGLYSHCMRVLLHPPVGRFPYINTVCPQLVNLCHRDDILRNPLRSALSCPIDRNRGLATP